MKKDNNKISTKKSRLLSAFLGAIVAFVTLYEKFNVDMLGFPDGHKTEFEGAQELIFRIFLLPKIILILCFSYLCFFPKKSTKRNMLVLILVFITMILVNFCLEYFLSLYLDNGGGG